MHPFRQREGGPVYATDGRIMVRLFPGDMIEDIYLVQDRPRIEGNGFAFDHDSVPADGWIPVPEVKTADYCLSCGGAGSAKRRCENCGEEHDCIPCEKCKGSGLIYDPMVVAIGGARFTAHYLRLIREELPGAVIEKDGPKSDMNRFRCGDVLGYLMPVRGE